jgi:hypothetical protein
VAAVRAVRAVGAQALQEEGRGGVGGVEECVASCVAWLCVRIGQGGEEDTCVI